MVLFTSRFNKSTIIFCTLSDHRNDVKMIKTSKWNQKLTKIIVDLFFTTTLTVLTSNSVKVSLKIAR